MLNPSEARARNALGVVLGDRGHFDAAAYEFDRALRLCRESEPGALSPARITANMANLHRKRAVAWLAGGYEAKALHDQRELIVLARYRGMKYDAIAQLLVTIRELQDARAVHEERTMLWPASDLVTNDDQAIISGHIREIMTIGQRVARTDVGILITGESGTGKELCAEAVHRFAGGSGRPFVAINCSAIPKELMESEIFGHVRGAFTGAADNRPGAAELADDPRPDPGVTDPLLDISHDLVGQLAEARGERGRERPVRQRRPEHPRGQVQPPDGLPPGGLQRDRRRHQPGRGRVRLDSRQVAPSRRRLMQTGARDSLAPVCALGARAKRSGSAPKTVGMPGGPTRRTFGACVHASPVVRRCRGPGSGGPGRC